MCVFPEPVCPYANTHTLWPSTAEATRAFASAKTSACVAVGGKTASKQYSFKGRAVLLLLLPPPTLLPLPLLFSPPPPPPPPPLLLLLLLGAAPGLFWKKKRE